ncbi:MULTISPECIES: type III secretion system protein [Burkholderia]|uniref:type III secretion system protein n=1 Tax=Burkholderia cepacia TaxID=292 RepID=UPI001E2ECCFA
MLARRRQLDRKLNAALGGLRGELQGLMDALEESRAAVRAHAAGLAAHDGKIDAMLGGVSFRADEYLKLREFRAHAAEQHAMLEARAAQAGQALAAKEAQIGTLRTEILRNRARIDIYGKRRDTLVKAIELAIEDAQDEETSESRRPNPAF